jgi:hypothetical protein
VGVSLAFALCIVASEGVHPIATTGAGPGSGRSGVATDPQADPSGLCRPIPKGASGAGWASRGSPGDRYEVTYEVTMRKYTPVDLDTVGERREVLGFPGFHGAAGELGRATRKTDVPEWQAVMLRRPVRPCRSSRG